MYEQVIYVADIPRGYVSLGAALLAFVGTCITGYFAYRASERAKPVSNGFAEKVLTSLEDIRESQGYLRGTLDQHIVDSAAKHQELTEAAEAAHQAAEKAATEAHTANELLAQRVTDIEQRPTFSPRTAQG